jgi:hypothetical protein
MRCADVFCRSEHAPLRSCGALINVEKPVFVQAGLPQLTVKTRDKRVL